MNHWSSGYVSEVAYTHGYYRELSPALINFALLCGQRRPLRPGPLRYLELGFGQGVSLALHAAACEGEFWGTDFNPVHTANARDYAAASGGAHRIFDDSFEEFARRPELPEFDVIVMHGIWSWVSAENRRVLVDLIRRKLAVGGCLYVSYNVTPGWSSTMPLRNLLSLHVRTASEQGRPLASRIDAALDFAKAVAGAGAGYFQHNPAMVGRIDRMKEQDHAYLAHEYFNADWHPMSFAEVAEQLAEAKLDFAGSGNIADCVPAISLTPQAQALLGGINNPVLRESVRDFFTDIQFRKDLWMKGTRSLDPLDQARLLQDTRVMLLVAPSSVPDKVPTILGEASLQPETYKPLTEALASDGFRPKSLGELCTLLPSLSKPILFQAVLVLVGTGYAMPAQSEGQAKANRDKCDRYNRLLIEHSSFTSTPAYLASPVIGAGFQVQSMMLWILREFLDGGTDDEHVVGRLWARLLERNQRMAKDGKALESEEDNRRELHVLVTHFRKMLLSNLKALQIL